MTAAAVPFTYDFELGRKASVVEADDGGLIISGLASDFDFDRDEEYVDRQAFRESVDLWLATNPIILWMHNWERPVGKALSAYVDDEGLHLVAKIDPAVSPHSWQADLIAKIKSKTVRALSIGGRFVRDIDAKGRQRIVRVDLMEISVCSVGRNARALFSVVAGKAMTAADGAAVINGDVIDALDERVIALAATLEHLIKDKDMKALCGIRPDWMHDRRTPLPALSPEEERRIKARNIAESAAWEAQRVDGVRDAGETIDVPVSAVIGRRRRDATGQPIDDAWELDDFRESEIPSEISGEALALLITNELPEAPPEPTPEMVFAQAERDAALARLAELRAVAADVDQVADVAEESADEPRRSLRDRLAGVGR